MIDIIYMYFYYTYFSEIIQVEVNQYEPINRLTHSFKLF